VLPATSFHDAEILSCRIERRGPTVEIDVEAFAGTERAVRYRLRFLEVTELELQGVSEQNVVFDLTAVHGGDSWDVTIVPSYGLSGTLRCREIESSTLP
jgi:hypothetical protein